MTGQTMAGALAAFAVSADLESLSEDARSALKIRVLDALACALGASDAEPVRRVRRYLDVVGGRPSCTLIGGGRTSPDRAALYNGARVRYLDFNDSYLAPRETCHPSDNLAPVLAAAEHAGADGRTLLAALAVAYQVQCRLSDEAPVRAKGFDHTVQGSYAVAAGASRALGLDLEATTNAIAIAGTAFNALRVTRTGALSQWKGLAAPNTAFCGVHATLLAREGITGPAEIFEGNKGFMHAIAGPFTIDWAREDLERVRRTIVKRYDAEIHSQSTLEALSAIRERTRLDPAAIDRVEIETFAVAYHIIGGGEEGEKTSIRTREQADHSLPYLAAVMLLDGEVSPRQYAPERIAAADVQSLLRRVTVVESPELSSRFPDAMPTRVRVVMKDGSEHTEERSDYRGFHTRPARWEDALAKLDHLAGSVPSERRRELAQLVRSLEHAQAADLCAVLAQAP